MWFLRRHRNDSAEEATLALQDAQQNLKEVKQRSREVSKVADALREIRQKNHFAEALEKILRPQRNTNDSE